MTGPNGFMRQQAMAWVAFIVLAFLSLSPPLSWLFMWFFPLPLIVFGVTMRVWFPAILSATYAVCLTYAGFGWSAWMVAFSVFFLSWVMADALKQGESIFAPLVTGTLVVIMIEVVLLSLVHWLGYNPIALLAQGLKSSPPSAHTGLSAAEWNGIVQRLAANITLLLPGLIAIAALLVSTANLTGARLMLGTLLPGQPGPENEGLLRAYRLPYVVSTIYLISIACTLFGVFRQTYFLWQCINNIALVSGFLTGVQGVSWLWRKLQKARAKWLLLIVLVVSGGLIRMVGQLYILIGLYDMLSQSRRRNV